MGDYGFGGRLSEEFPSQIIIDATETCNLACIHCPHSDVASKKLMKNEYLDSALNAKMVEEAYRDGRGILKHIRYTANGEPLTHPNIFEMLEQSAKNSGTFVSITTNATLLNSKKARILLNTGISMVDISIDAFKEDTYSKIRVGGKLETTRDNVLNLIQLKKELNCDTKIIVSFVEQEENKNEADSFKEFWESNGVDSVVIRRLHSAGGIKKKFSGVLSERRPCVYPWERIILNARGHLSYCPNCWNGKSDIIDFRNTTIVETWKSDYYKRLREANLYNSFEGFEYCGSCPDWEQTRWPEEGRSYADLISDLSDKKVQNQG